MLARRNGSVTTDVFRLRTHRPSWLYRSACSGDSNAAIVSSTGSPAMICAVRAFHEGGGQLSAPARSSHACAPRKRRVREGGRYRPTHLLHGGVAAAVERHRFCGQLHRAVGLRRALRLLEEGLADSSASSSLIVPEEGP